VRYYEIEILNGTVAVAACPFDHLRHGTDRVTENGFAIHLNAPPIAIAAYGQRMADIADR